MLSHRTLYSSSSLSCVVSGALLASSGQMYILSWNVAGWSSTSQTIQESFGSLRYFFACTKADIICIQEAKGTMARMQATPTVMGAEDLPTAKQRVVEPVDGFPLPPPPTPDEENDAIAGWESFWSHSGRAHRGFNGVATFAKKGLTWRCERTPFQDADLDDEGRTLVTHYSAFIIVNVYVPNARGGARSSYKRKFLAALLRLLERLRLEHQKPVILLGDLNLSYRADDACWSMRRLELQQLLQLDGRGSAAVGGGAPPSIHLPRPTLQWLLNGIANHLCSVVRGLGGTSGAVGSPRTLSLQGSSSPTVKSIAVDDLDGWEGGEEQVVALTQLQARLASLPRPSSPQFGSSPTLNGNEPPIKLKELMEAGFENVFVGDLVRSTASPSLYRDLFTLVRLCGRPPHGEIGWRFVSCLTGKEVPFLASSVKNNNNINNNNAPDTDSGGCGDEVRPLSVPMVDAFLVGEAYCPCPYTCWDQSRNRRQINEGTRIDYFFVDAALAPHIVPRANTTNNSGVMDGDVDPLTINTNEEEDWFSELLGSARRDGIRRATADGAYPPAPFDGTGMAPLGDHCRGFLFRGLPSSGLFVTPPQFSDHIGVGLLLKDIELLPRSTATVVGANGCQYLRPRGLRSFFAKVSAAPAAPVACQPPAKAARVEMKPRDAVAVMDVDADDDA